MSALDIQIGGEHYKNAKIQPIQYIEANGLGFLEGCVVKRITRHDKPTGKGRQDIEKSIHELQLLLEFRYPGAPAAYQDGETIVVYTPEQKAAVYAALSAENQRVTPVPEDIYAEFAARVGTAPRVPAESPGVDINDWRTWQVGDLLERTSAVCPRVYTVGCLYPVVSVEQGSLCIRDNFSGGSYCDQPAKDLQAKFRWHSRPGTCPECGYPTDAAGTHYATCSQLTAPEEYKAEAQVAFDEAAEISEALARQVSAGEIVEPAAAMDDDSPRMQAIGQNGNDGEHYDDPWAGAPKWAKYKAQDMNGDWWFYETPPHCPNNEDDAWSVVQDAARRAPQTGEPNPNWRDTLIART